MGKAMILAMRMLLAGLLLVLAATAGATAQVPDRAFIEGRDDALDTNPLESQLRDRPDFPPENVSRGTANWRGYVAHRRSTATGCCCAGSRYACTTAATKAPAARLAGPAVSRRRPGGRQLIQRRADHPRRAPGQATAPPARITASTASPRDGWSRRRRSMPNRSAPGASGSSRRSGRPRSTTRRWSISAES